MLLEDVKMTDALMVVDVCEAHASFMEMTIEYVSRECATDMGSIKAGLEGRSHDELAVLFGEGEG